MDYLIFIVIAIIFFIVSFKVGVKKRLDLINTIDEEDLKKINNKESISKKFGLYYFFLGIISLLCARVTDVYGSIGLGISISILMTLFFISVIMAIRLYWSL
ncbi:MAG: hypothetical protein ACRCTZ_03440 [Sarcina sp.]